MLMFNAQVQTIGDSPFFWCFLFYLVEMGRYRGRSYIEPCCELHRSLWWIDFSNSSSFVIILFKLCLLLRSQRKRKISHAISGLLVVSAASASLLLLLFAHETCNSVNLWDTAVSILSVSILRISCCYPFMWTFCVWWCKLCEHARCDGEAGNLNKAPNILLYWTRNAL